MKRPPHTKDLRKGRHSEPNARYFTTFNTKPPSTPLNTPTTFAALKSTIQTLNRDAIMSPIAFVLMPDHVHALFRLGTVLELGKAIARLKFEFRKPPNRPPSIGNPISKTTS